MKKTPSVLPGAPAPCYPSPAQDSVSAQTNEAGCWEEGPLPHNVRAGKNTLISGHLAFKRYHATQPDALILGDNGTFDGVHFCLGIEGRVRVGDFCYLTNVVLLCELEVVIGNYVLIGWNTTITDTDFHPIAPALRVADAIACSPLGNVRRSRAVERRPVVIEDNVWIGPNSTILKGVRIGAGAIIEPGSMVTQDVPPGAWVMGNPAQMVELGK